MVKGYFAQKNNNHSNRIVYMRIKGQMKKTTKKSMTFQGGLQYIECQKFLASIKFIQVKKQVR